MTARLHLPLPQQILEIQPLDKHRKRAVRRPRPLLLRPVPIEFDAALVGIAQVKRFANAMIAGAVERNLCLYEAMQGVRQRRAGRIEDRGVKQPGRSRRRWMPALAFPGVEADVVVIAAGRNERRAGTHALHQFKPEHAAIKPERAIEIGHFQVNMPDSRSRDDGCRAWAVPPWLPSSPDPAARFELVGTGLPDTSRRNLGFPNGHFSCIWQEGEG